MLWLICAWKSVQEKEREKESEEAGWGGGGSWVINNSRDCHRGQRALFRSAPGAPYEHPFHTAAAGTD